MRRYLLSIAILLSSVCTLLGQETKKELSLHPQVGAEWYYSKNEPLGEQMIRGFYRVYIEKDTIIDNYSLKKMVEEKYTKDKSKPDRSYPYFRYWYYDDGKCYEYFPNMGKNGEVKGSLILHYDLKANVGDTIAVKEFKDRRNSINKLIVQEKGVVEINGYQCITQVLRIYKALKPEESEYSRYQDYRFTQLIGFEDYGKFEMDYLLSLRDIACGSIYTDLRYFEDKNLGFSYRPEGAPEKDYFYIPSANTEIGALSELVVFYHNGRLVWKNPQGSAVQRLSLYTIQGDRVCQVSLRGNEESFLLPIPQGVYIYRLESKDGKVFSGKIQIK